MIKRICHEINGVIARIIAEFSPISFVDQRCLYLEPGTARVREFHQTFFSLALSTVFF